MHRLKAIFIVTVSVLLLTLPLITVQAQSPQQATIYNFVTVKPSAVYSQASTTATVITTIGAYAQLPGTFTTGECLPDLTQPFVECHWLEVNLPGLHGFTPSAWGKVSPVPIIVIQTSNIYLSPSFSSEVITTTADPLVLLNRVEGDYWYNDQRQFGNNIWLSVLINGRFGYLHSSLTNDPLMYTTPAPGEPFEAVGSHSPHFIGGYTQRPDSQGFRTLNLDMINCLENIPGQSIWLGYPEDKPNHKEWLGVQDGFALPPDVATVLSIAGPDAEGNSLRIDLYYSPTSPDYVYALHFGILHYSTKADGTRGGYHVNGGAWRTRTSDWLACDISVP